MNHERQAASDHKWHPLLAVSIAAFMLLLDVTVVNVALPDIQRDIEASFDELQWVIDAYALTLAATMLIFGSMADRFGRRRLFIIGLGVFSVASLACGLAPDPLSLNVFRGVQGLGGAAMLSTSLALIAAAYTGRERAVALSVWGATVAGAVAMGPLIGGALVDSLSWEWVFFVNVPIGLITAWLVAGGVPESSDPTASGRVDIFGLAALAGSMTTLILALVQGNEQGWGSATIIALFAASVLLLGVFVAIERRVANPLLDLGLFRKPSTWGASITILTIAISVFAMLTYLVLYLQSYLGYDAFDTGLRLFPLTIASFFAAAAVARLTERIPHRFLLAGGLAIAGIGTLLNRQVEVGSEWTVLLAGWILIGVGAGTVNPSVAATALGTAPVRQSGMASGLNNSFRLLGVAIGVAALGAVMEAEVESSLADSLGKPPAHGLVDLVATGRIEVGAQLGGADAVAASQQAFISGFDTILLVAAVVALAGALLALVLVRARDFVAQDRPGPVG